MKIKIFFFAVLFVGVFGLTQNSKALDVTAADLELATVQAAVNQVYAAGGGTVYLPAGTATWTAALISQGGVNIIGAGSPHTSQDANGKWGPEPTTVIVGAMGKASYGTTIYVNMSGHPIVYAPTRIANIKFIDAGPTNYAYGFINFSRGMNGIRIDHCEFNGANYQVKIMSDTSTNDHRPTGVLDHSNFLGSTFSGVGGYGVYVGQTYVIDNKPLGTGDAFFVEDNYFNGRLEHPISGFSGAHIVFRNNKLFQGTTDCAFGGVDVHGPGSWSSPSKRGGGPWEIYNNSFIQNTTESFGGTPACVPTRPASPTAIRMRSLHGVVWGNYFKNYQNATRWVSESYSCSPACPANGYTCDYDRIGASGNNVLGVYIWGNTYSNVVPLSGASVHWITNEACSKTAIHYDTEIFGYNDNGVDNFGVQMPGYIPYVYPHPLVSGAELPPSYQCSDGEDNDGDGMVDYPADPGCFSATDNDEFNAPASDTTPPAAPSGLSVM